MLSYVQAYTFIPNFYTTFQVELCNKVETSSILIAAIFQVMQHEGNFTKNVLIFRDRYRCLN